MTYNFFDDPAPSLPTEIDVTGAVVLEDGTPQGNLLSSKFSAGSVSVSIIPPSGWTLDSVTWSNGSAGVLPVPNPGVEETHTFEFVVSQRDEKRAGNGNFKIKKQSDGS